MNKAFLFDMDGVLVDSESIWAREEPGFMASVFGKEIAERIGDTIGVGVNEIYDKAVGYGSTLSKDEYLTAFDEKARTINDRGLESKPSPAGFRLALEELDADPTRSIVLEDSNRGIASGKAAGCHVIGYREYLVPGYEQIGADAYADSMADVIKLVDAFDRR